MMNKTPRNWVFRRVVSSETLKVKPRLLLLLSMLLLPALVMTVKPAHAQLNKSGFKPGDVLVYCQPGTPQDQVQALANKIGAQTIKTNLLSDFYTFVLPPNMATAIGTTGAVATLKGDAHVRWTGVNLYGRVFATKTPNDPRYASGEQWALKMINMPQAWALQLGNNKAQVCVIDTGFSTTHEDLAGQYDPINSHNWSDDAGPTGNSNINAPNTANEAFHGIGTGGLIIAATNNGKGIASPLGWGSSKLVFMRIQDDAGNFTLDVLTNAVTDAVNKQNTAHIGVITMSVGFSGVDPTDSTQPFYQACKKATDAGIIFFASAGNEATTDTTSLVPGGFSFVGAISAVGPTGTLATYSSFGKVAFAAPGGDQDLTGNLSDGCLVPDFGNTYSFYQGTSYASPYAAAVAGLVLGAPNVTGARALQVMQQTANKTGLSTIPDFKYGYGIVDAYAALLKVSVSAVINAPAGIDPTNPLAAGNGGLQPAPVESLKPTMSFSVTNVPPSGVTFTLDPGLSNQVTFTLSQVQAGTVAAVSDVSITGDTTSANPQYDVSFRYAFPNAVPFTHTIQISATNVQTGVTALDTRTFNIVFHTILPDSSGVTFISIPYFESAADQTAAQKNGRGTLIDPTSTILYRWINALVQNPKSGQTQLLGSYAVFGGGVNDVDASLNPLDFVPTIDGAATNTAPPTPLGVGYFIKSSGPIPYVTYGEALTDSAFRIPLHEGWNMIGDPFPFSVAYNSVLVEKPNGQRLIMQDAVDAGLILPHIYHYTSGEYNFQSLPNGTLTQWQGQWIYVLPRNGGTTLSQGLALTLIVPPAGVDGTLGKAAKGMKTASGPKTASLITRAAANTLISQPRVSGAGSWAIRLVASSRNLKDSYNYIGMSSKATLGDDFTKVPKPPKPSPYLTLGMTRANSSLGLLAQDLEPIGGSHTWNVSVTTDQANTDITLTWPDINTLPRGYRLTLTDTVTGQSVDLHNNSSYQFNSGHNAATRSFTLTATPSNVGGLALLSNITVNPSSSVGGRSTGTYEIGYTVSKDVRVEISILSFNGHVISNVGPTRAATSGNNKMVWNGLDNAGHTIPGGSYLLQLRAITPEGQVTRQVVPLLITGR